MFLVTGITGKVGTLPAGAMFEAVNAGWMEGTERVAGTSSHRDVFAAARKAATA